MKKLMTVLAAVLITATASAQTKTTAENTSLTNDKTDTTSYGLPVLKSYVAPDAVERAKKKYGRSLYSIEKSTAADCLQSYLVGLIRNGRLTMDWMCDDPKLAFQRNEPGSALL